jgi:hypothetical protein
MDSILFIARVKLRKTRTLDLVRLPTFSWASESIELINNLELCYSIRYMDKNGRDPKKPWSLRQVGVYQQTRSPEKRSVWILVQPPERLHQQLKSAIVGTSRHEWSKQDRDMVLHLAVLSVTLSNWDQYIEYLRNELTQLVSLNHFR